MSQLKAIIEVVGNPGAGKTSVILSLGEELAPSPILYIDASPDQKLTHALAPASHQFTLADLLAQSLGLESKAPKEALDWAFSDLAVPVGHEQELLVVGKLPDVLPAEVTVRLQYGLTRLLAHYDYILVDGLHTALSPLWPEALLREVFVLTPKDFVTWHLEGQPWLSHTPALILNAYEGETLPAELEEAIESGKLQLIGKLPRYENDEQKIRHFSEAFRNCLLRLNVPFPLNPS